MALNEDVDEDRKDDKHNEYNPKGEANDSGDGSKSKSSSLLFRDQQFHSSLIAESGRLRQHGFKLLHINFQTR